MNVTKEWKEEIVRDFRDLKVWEKAHRSILDIYRKSKNFPEDERFGLTSQMRRAAVSIASNIAEGCGRGSDCDFGRFLRISAGSACEVEYQLLLSRDLGYLEDETYYHINEQICEVKKCCTVSSTPWERANKVKFG